MGPTKKKPDTPSLEEERVKKQLEAQERLSKLEKLAKKKGLNIEGVLTAMENATPEQWELMLWGDKPQLYGLDEPFPEEDIEWRIAELFIWNDKPGAVILPYVTSRAVHERLDQVVGKANWMAEYKAGPLGGILCKLSLRINGEWVSRTDGAENTSIEPVKGGLSDALKRAAVQWGIGRHLYRLPKAYAVVSGTGTHKAHGQASYFEQGEKKKKPVSFRWDPPTLARLWANEKAKQAKAKQAQGGSSA
jgi:hypothetical protein